jgi:hypothetical protein
MPGFRDWRPELGSQHRSRARRGSGALLFDGIGECQHACRRLVCKHRSLERSHGQRIIHVHQVPLDWLGIFRQRNGRVQVRIQRLKLGDTAALRAPEQRFQLRRVSECRAVVLIACNLRHQSLILGARGINKCAGLVEGGHRPDHLLPEIVDRGIEGLNSREDPANCVLDRAGDGSQQRDDVGQPRRTRGAREQKQRIRETASNRFPRPSFARIASKWRKYFFI